MKDNKIKGSTIAFTYIGVVVGAGFASGQEILRFFNVFGLYGLLGIVMATILFIFLGYFIMKLGYRLNARNHIEILNYASNGVIKVFFDVFITIFLFGTFVAMLSGTGALIGEFLNLPNIVGSGFMALLSTVIVILGVEGVIMSISVLVPFLVAIVFGVAIFTLSQSPTSIFEIGTFEVASNGFIHNWFIAMVLYVSYNLSFSISLLAPLGAKAKNMKEVKKGAVIGGLGLGLGAMLIFLTMNQNINDVSHYEIPMLVIASKIGYLVGVVYAVVLVAEIFTTAVGNLYGFVSRISKSNSEGMYKIVAVFTGVFGVVAAQFGFTNIVTYLYPLMGYGGLVLILFLLIRHIQIKNKN